MPNFVEKLRSPIYKIESLTFLKLEMEVKKLRKFLSIMIYKILRKVFQWCTQHFDDLKTIGQWAYNCRCRKWS